MKRLPNSRVYLAANRLAARLYGAPAIKCNEGSDRGQEQCEHTMELTLKICRERSNVILTENLVHPGVSILALSPDDEARARHRAQMNMEFQTLLFYERMALRLPNVKAMLASVPWRNWEWVRLYFHLNEVEHGMGTLPIFSQSLAT